jgi:hypothetical protein
MKVLTKVCDRVEEELESFCKNPDWTSSDIQVIGWLVDQSKDIETIWAMKDAGYSQANARMSYDDPAMSYARYGNRSYDDGYSERRGRDAMGRYTSRDGYSTHNESMIDMLKDKMHNTTSEVERENYRRVIEQLER